MTDEREGGAISPLAKDRRWDIDPRGEGVADARELAPRIRALQEAAEEPLWVTEEPDAHLWPHVQRAIEEDGSSWTAAEYAITEDGCLLIQLVHAPIDGDRRWAVLQADVLRLLGLVIEGATYLEVRRGTNDTLVVDVVTGLLDDQTPFRSHGHTLRVRATSD